MNRRTFIKAILALIPFGLAKKLPIYTSGGIVPKGQELMLVSEGEYILPGVGVDVAIPGKSPTVCFRIGKDGYVCRGQYTE